MFSRSFSNKKWVIVFASFLVFVTTQGVFFYRIPERAVAITLNGQKRIVKTHANTVAELLREQKIILHGHDQISPKPQTAIKDQMVIGILRGFPLIFVDGGKAKQVWSTSATVADFLTQQELKLNQFDGIEPSLAEGISENGAFNSIRVEKVTDVVEEPIDFAVITKKDGNLTKGTRKTITEGQQGLVSRKYEVILENGVEIARKLINEQKLKDKQDKVVAVETKNVNQKASRSAVKTGIEYYVNTTAYTANCGGCSGRTTIGINLRANPNLKVIAVDPRIIPLGTKVYVDGYGYAIAADTGSAIKGYKIDLYFPSRADCYSWGARRVKIKVLK